MKQKLVQETLLQESSIESLNQWLSCHHFPSRCAFGKFVCQQFSFFNALKQPQLSTTLVALNHLENKGFIALPDLRSTYGGHAPKMLAEPVEKADYVPQKVRQLGLVDVLLVDNDPHKKKIWNRIMHDEHPQGTAIFAGCQLRYLFTSDRYGYLGGAGLAASALNVADRDRWIGWDSITRKENLHRVLGLSRLLIRPHVICRGLASMLLSHVLRRLGKDFLVKYGYDIWLIESFCDLPYRGTCLLAANFFKVGYTAGRGRGDTKRAYPSTKKAVLLYELEPKWRKYLDLRSKLKPYQVCLEPGDGISQDTWAVKEFGGAPLGDIRLSKRLVQSVNILSSYTTESICGQDKPNQAAIQGFYRFIEKPDDSEVNTDNILKPHLQRSILRMRSQKTILALVDSTVFNFNTRPACENLQVIGSNQTQAKSLGIHMQLTLATTTKGLSLGILKCDFDPATQEKKTERWSRSFDHIENVSHELTRKNHVIAVMDREADIYELFLKQKQAQRADILVRARHNRKLDPNEKLFSMLKQTPSSGDISIEISPQSMRKKTSKVKAKPKREKRMAHCTVKFRELCLKPKQKDQEKISLWGVHLEETNPLEGTKPLSWTLLTSIKIRDVEKAVLMVEHYLQRWKIEELFKVIKSGCKVEDSGFRTRERLQRVIAINSVLAWRIMLMCHIGREVPDYSPDLMFSDDELEFLEIYANEYKQDPPTSLKKAIGLTALIGGYRDRKSDPDPGSKTIWRGMHRLSTACMTYQIVKKRYEKS